MMKFKVVGTNLRTAARMVIEVEANNRAAAERAASQAGMEVLHLEYVPDDPIEQLLRERRSRTVAADETAPLSHRSAWIALAVAAILVVIAVSAFWFKMHAVPAQ